ncbi:MAG: PIN domain-containing protein [Luteitalea sp.]|nr:PIN domain-containing protein [Luteitalea sp.]
MSAVLVDSNVILDVLAEDQEWQDWSAFMLASCADAKILVVNPVIYAEISVYFDRIEDLDEALPTDYYRREAIPYEAGFLAAKCFVQYRRRGGRRCSPLPDFFIGAHAAVRGMTLLTRDARRYRSYFPKLRILAP